MTELKTRLFVVEDESLVAEDLRERLGRMGYEVCYVTDSGEDALLRSIDLLPDLILLDIRLRGGMDGIAVAERLRKMSRIPVVFLTAHADRATLERAGRTEPFGYVLKPFVEEELEAAIQIALYRHRAEERYRKMERWLSTTLQSIGDGVIAVDAHRRVTFINAVAERLLGRTGNNAVGLPFEEVFPLEKEGLGPVAAPVLPMALEDGLSVNFDGNFAVRTTRGGLALLDGSIAPIRDDDETITGAIIVFRDCTAQRRAAVERRRMELRMQEAQRLECLGVLAGGIAHDFKNYLTAISGNVSLCSSLLPANSPYIPYLKDAEEAAIRAGQLCAQMQAYAGSDKIDVAVFDFSAFVDECVQLLQIGISKRTQLLLELAPDLPTIEADRNQIQQIIMNLVINAAEALEDRPGTIRIRTERFNADAEFFARSQLGHDLPPGEYLMLSVSDSGPGMNASTMSRVFDPFFTTKGKGRGLGLAVVLGIVRGHRGALLLESTPDEGTTFRVLLAPSQKKRAPFAKKLVSQEWRGSGRVLLVDDEVSIRSAVTALLKAHGFEVITAARAEEGLRILAAQRSAVVAVMTDITLPGTSGMEIYEEARRNDQKLPILLISGYMRDLANERFRFDPHAAFLAKPFTAEELRRSLATLIPG
ncbi:MAG TPA: response regulator [Chthoniobacteraceae bacterium]|jgi:PAS domain S-box-containing protein